MVSAIDKLIDYVISNEGEELLNDIADQIVDEADNLGRDTLIYITEAAGALAIRDDRTFSKALQSIFLVLQNENGTDKRDEEKKSSSATITSTGLSKIIGKLRKYLGENFPEPTPAMQRSWKLALLLGTRGASSFTTVNNGNVASDAAKAISKFVPLIRKLSQEPRVTRKANEVVARLGERIVSRGLRAAFGLPPPVFQNVESSTNGKKK